MAAGGVLAGTTATTATAVAVARRHVFFDLAVHGGSRFLLAVGGFRGSLRSSGSQTTSAICCDDWSPSTDTSSNYDPVDQYDSTDYDQARDAAWESLIQKLDGLRESGANGGSTATDPQSNTSTTTSQANQTGDSASSATAEANGTNGTTASP